MHYPKVNIEIEHSENKIITQSGLYENEIVPGILQSSIQQIRVLQKHQMHKPCATDYVPFLSLIYELFADCTFVKRWTGSFQVQPRFRNTC